MKSTLQCFFLLFVAVTLNSQSSVNIQINHLLDGVRYENEINTVNDLGNDFMIDRLQYYISGFSITHDGGQVTEVEDLYVLVSLLNDSESTMIDLGELTFTTLESVNFNLGVDQEANHSDPSLYHPTHALYPKSPSMHWGWTSGYRFIALEGKSGPNVNQNLELHCVGDQFYQQLEFDVNMSGEDSYLIELNAEYTNLLSGIDVSSGLIVHGNGNPIPTLSNNMIDKLFSLSVSTNTSDSDLFTSFDVYPNPVTNGQLTINLDLASTNNTIRIQDALGRVVLSQSQSNLNTVNLPNSGIYFVSVSDARGTVLATRKLIVQ